MQRIIGIEAVQVSLAVIALFAGIFLAGFVVYVVWMAALRWLDTFRIGSLRQHETGDAHVVVSTSSRQATVHRSTLTRTGNSPDAQF